MKNWQDYVGLQPVNSDSQAAKNLPARFVFYMEFKEERAPMKDDEGVKQVAALQLAILKGLVPSEDYIYDEDTIGDAVEDLMLTFKPARDNLHGDQGDLFRVQRARNQIAQWSRRGAGNREFDTDTHKVVMYGGSNPTDWPIIVSQFNDRFAIFKHPKFYRYGQLMEKI